MREQELEAAQREVQQQAARAAEHEAALSPGLPRSMPEKPSCEKQGETLSANTDEVNSLQAGFESELAGWNRERRQFQIPTKRPTEGFKQAERKIRRP